jgi:hypothetical protein
MAVELISSAKETAHALSTFADLLGNEHFIRRVIKIEEDTREREVCSQNPHAYFRSHGIELPSAMKVTIGSFIACIATDHHYWCLTIDGKGIRITEGEG